MSQVQNKWSAAARKAASTARKGRAFQSKKSTLGKHSPSHRKITASVIKKGLAEAKAKGAGSTYRKNYLRPSAYHKSLAKAGLI